MALQFAIGTDNSVKIIGLTDNDDGTYVNDATVTGNLYHESDLVTPVDNGSDITLSYIAGSDGGYLGHIPDDVVWVEGHKHVFRATVVSGTKKWTFDIMRVAKYDKAGVR